MNARIGVGTRTSIALAGTVALLLPVISSAQLPDTTAPQISVSAPLPGVAVAGAVPVTAVASDNVGVAGVQFKVDGADFGAEDSAPPYTVSWNTLGSSDLIVGAVKVIVTPMAITAGTGFTKRLSLSCSSCTSEDLVTEDRIHGTPGAVAATFTLSNTAHYLAQMAAFRASGAPAFVQGAKRTQQKSPKTSIAQTFAASVAAGNLIVAVVAWQTNVPISVTDSGGNAYTVATTAYDPVNNQSLAIVFAANAAGGRTTTTVSFGTATPIVQRLQLLEYRGIATISPLDAVAKSVGDAATAANAVTTGSTATSVTTLVSNGTHSLSAVARDTSGNVTTSVLVPVIVTNGVDATPPTVSITAPAAGATISGAVTVSAAASDDVGVAGVQFKLDGAPLGAEDTALPYSISWDTTTSSLGNHSLTAVARDLAGNQTTSAVVTVAVANDATAPVITNVTSSSITMSGATIVWTTNETSDSQVEYGPTLAYGSTTAIDGTLVMAHSAALSGLTDGIPYHFRVRSRDAAGNLAVSGDATFTTLDGTAPAVSITQPVTGSTVSAAVTVTANATDNVGVAGVQFKLDGVNLGSEDTSSPYSIPWNTLGSQDLIVAVAKVAVAPMVISAGSGFTKRLSVSCPSCTSEDTVTEDKVQTAPGATAATFTLSAPAHYLAQMAAFKAAGTPVYVQGSANTQQNSGTTTIAQAFGSPVGSGNLIVAAVAWHTNAVVSATDSTGNVYSVATSAYDSVNNQSVAILYAANAIAGATTVTVSFGSATPIVQRLEIHEYAGIATSNPLDVSAANIADGLAVPNGMTSGSAVTSVTASVSNGSHTLSAVARDAAGNTATSPLATVTVSNLTAPVISGVTASAVLYSTATINWTTNEASDSQVEYGPTTAYGSLSTLTGTTVTSHTTPLTALNPSTLYHYRVRSRNAAGNLAVSGDFTFTTLEATPPTVSITAPVSGATLAGTISVTATASDNVGVVGVQFKLDGAPLGAEDTSAPYSVSWNTVAGTQGLHSLAAVARDAAGNQTTSAPVSVTVGNSTVEVSLAWNASAGSNVAGYTIHYGTASGTYTVAVDVGNITICTLAGLQPGILYYFVAAAYDANRTESAFSNEVSALK